MESFGKTVRKEDFSKEIAQRNLIRAHELLSEVWNKSKDAGRTDLEAVERLSNFMERHNLEFQRISDWQRVSVKIHPDKSFAMKTSGEEPVILPLGVYREYFEICLR